MQPRYMGRTMNTYPVSESEMELISSFNAQTTVRYSIATFTLGLACSIWVNASFYDDLTQLAIFATKYAAPFFLLCAAGFAIGGSMAQYQRGSLWDRIKRESNPVQTVAAPVIATAETDRTAA
jgi:hypothetical protein